MTELPLISPGLGPDPLVHDQNYRLLREKFNGGIDETDISAGGVSNDNLAGGIPPAKLQGAYSRGVVTIENTAAESLMISQAFAAGEAVNRELRVSIIGAVNNNSGAGRTITFRLKFGATTLWGDVTPSLGASGTFRAFTADVLMSVRAGFQGVGGNIRIGSASAGSVAGFGSDPPAVDFVLGGNSSEDATTAKTMQFTAQPSAAHASFQLFVSRVALELF